MANQRKHFPRLNTDHLLIVDVESKEVTNKDSQFYGKTYAYDFGAMLINLKDGLADRDYQDTMGTLFDHSMEGISYRLWTAKHRKDPVRKDDEGIIKPEDFWSVTNLKSRKKKYRELYLEGKRSMSVPKMVDDWIGSVLHYNYSRKPVVAAYNIAYDAMISGSTSIDNFFSGYHKPYKKGHEPEWLDGVNLPGRGNFVDLYVIAQKALLRKKAGNKDYEDCEDNPYCDKKIAKRYEDWASKNGYLTKKGRPILTAEKLGWFIGNTESMISEPHTALEDIRFFERHIARWLRQQRFI